MMYTIASQGGESNIVVFLPGQEPLIAHSSHPNYDTIVERVLDQDAEGLAVLFDPTPAIAERFETLSDRISVSGGRIYLDGDEVDNALTQQVLRFLDSGVLDWVPLVNFYEKLLANPEEHSREQLYRWLQTHDFTITESGDIVGYKGVAKDATGNLVSVNSGSAIVDGEQHLGQIPNYIGAVVEMPRSAVTFDPAVGCSTGLHVGTFEYARGWGTSGALLEVHVNPRDVVSVPTDSGDAKLRTCRYQVINTIDVPYTSAVIPDPDFSDDEDDWRCSDPDCVDCY